MLGLFLTLAIFVSLVDSQFTSTRNFWPAAYPLAVRSPYLNTWMDSLETTTSLNNWPLHWDDSNIMGWSGFVRIDGVTWQWMGAGGPGNGTTLRNSEVTPTSTRFQVVAGPMLLNLTFLSPIEPSDWVRQSLPFTYLSLEASSLDGETHDVQVYSDISAEWISGNRQNIATWQTRQTSSSVYHQAQLQTPQNMTEINNIAEDSTVYYAMKTVPSMTWQSGRDATVRGQFGGSSGTGELTNQQDTNFRAINDDFVVFGISVDLGNIQTTNAPIVWGLGLVRDPVTVTTTASGAQQNRRSYFWSNYSTISDAIDAFLADYDNAVQRANALDQQIMNDAQAISSEYVDLVCLAARQAMAIADITVGEGSDGKLNTSDVQVFMRDVGVGQRANPVDTIYSAFPIYLYLNASLGGMLLSPLLEYQSSSQYPNNYAAPDLGSLFPKALGDSSDTHNQGVENTGDMLIMAYAHARLSGDGSLIKQYYTLLKSWADYLVANSLYPSGQVSADGISNGNITNLAIKGIIGIGAMAGISDVMNEPDDAHQYSVNASTMVRQWLSLASSSNHLLGTYNSDQSSALMYNLYADLLLRTNLVDQSVYAEQTSFYSNESQTSAQFGLPFDSSLPNQANSAWTLFTAATTTNNATRDQLVDRVHARAGFNQTKGDFPTMYNPSNGNSSAANGQASPGQGGIFALLALNVENKTITFPLAPQSAGPSETGNSSSSHSNAGVIAGAVIGSIVGVAVLVVIGLLFWRRRRRQQESYENESAPVPFDPTLLSRPRSDAVMAEHGLHASPIPFTAQAPNPNPMYVGGGSRKRQPDTGQQTHWESGTQSSNAVTNSDSLSSPTQSQALGSAVSRSDASQLRNDVESLRREMEELRMEREYAALAMVPPPQYGS